ncbi:MAG: hypothetical protein Q8Q14_04705 [Gemmatimonadales bacterium]|nr:hypothetical protein [Gemmatimonadales bacterium]
MCDGRCEGCKPDAGEAWEPRALAAEADVAALNATLVETQARDRDANIEALEEALMTATAARRDADVGRDEARAACATMREALEAQAAADAARGRALGSDRWQDEQEAREKQRRAYNLRAAALTSNAGRALLDRLLAAEAALAEERQKHEETKRLLLGLREFHLVVDGVEAAMTGEACRAFARTVAGYMLAFGAENYVETTLETDGPSGRFVLTFQRADGLTPHEARMQAEAGAATMRGALEEVVLMAERMAPWMSGPVPPADHYSLATMLEARAALATDAGRPLLERLRAAEADVARMRRAIETAVAALADNPCACAARDWFASTRARLLTALTRPEQTDD